MNALKRLVAVWEACTSAFPIPSTRVGQRGSEHARAYPYQYREEVSHLRVSRITYSEELPSLDCRSTWSLTAAT
jgi:hypothetical protein